MKAKKMSIVPQTTRVVLETITPERAAEILGKKAANRPLSEGMVARYAGEMLSGNWRLTGDTIKFDTNGHLIDGQHRLAACATSGISMQTFVAYGIKNEAMDVMDGGKKRTPADALHRKGYKNTHRLAAAARWLINIKAGYETRASRSQTPTNKEVIDLVSKHPGLTDSCRASEGVRGMPQSLAATIHYIGCHLVDRPDEADSFVTTFRIGVPNVDFFENAEVDPALKWREKLLHHKKGKYALTDSAIYNGSVYSWNKYVAREGLVQGKFPKTGQEIDGLDKDKI